MDTAPVKKGAFTMMAADITLERRFGTRTLERRRANLYSSIQTRLIRVAWGERLRIVDAKQVMRRRGLNRLS